MHRARLPVTGLDPRTPGLELAGRNPRLGAGTRVPRAVMVGGSAGLPVPAGSFVGYDGPVEAGGGVICDVGTADEVIDGVVHGDAPPEARMNSQMIGIPDGAGSAGVVGDQRSVISQPVGLWASSQANAIQPQPWARASVIMLAAYVPSVWLGHPNSVMATGWLAANDIHGRSIVDGS